MQQVTERTICIARTFALHFATHDLALTNGSLNLIATLGIFSRVTACIVSPVMLIEPIATLATATLATAANFEVNRFRYYYHYKYGSPWVDEARVAVTAVRPSADGLSAELALAELKPGFVYELSLAALRTTDNQPLANPLGYYTANRLLNGERTVVLALDKSPMKDRPADGHVGFQDEAKRVWYRGVRIKELK